MVKSKKRESCETIANIFISFIGAGVLGLPYAFMKSGLLEGTLVMAFVAYMSIRAMLLLIDCKYKIHNVLGPHNLLSRVRCSKGKDYSPLKVEDFPSDRDDDKSSKASSLNSSRSGSPIVSTKDGITYSDVGFAAFGHIGRLIVDVTILISQVGFCCAYLIFISENMSSRFPSISKTQWLGFLMPVLFFLTLIPDLNKLALGSFVAQVSNLLAFGVVLWFDFDHLHLATEKDHLTEFSLEGFPFFFSIAIYCFEGAGMILSLEQSVPEHQKSHFRRLFIITLTMVTLLYIAFGVSGYLSYGPNTRDIITLNLPHNPKGMDFAALVKYCLCFSLIFTYPVMMFPVTTILHQRLKMWNCCSCINTDDKWFGAILRILLVTLTGVTVILVPRFADIMSLIGATCCTLLAFIMPALCHLALHKPDLSKGQQFFDWCLLFVGCLGMALGTNDAIKTILRNNRSMKPVKSI